MKNQALWMVSAAALVFTIANSSSEAARPTMVDVAEKLYRNATPQSFAGRCKANRGKLEADGDRHTCSSVNMTSIVRFSDDRPKSVTVHKKGLHKEVVGQLKRKLGAPSSVKTLGAMKMHFWFTKDASVSVGFQTSSESRSTMVSFRSPS